MAASTHKRARPRFSDYFRSGRKRARDMTRTELLRNGPIDLPFLVLTLLLLGIGLLMLMSASSYAALYDKTAGYVVKDGVIVSYGDPYYYVKRQAIFAVVGIIAMAFFSMLDYQRLRLLSVPLLFGSIVLLILVLIPFFGQTSNNATRWLKLFLVAGPTYEPSELAKLGIVLFFSAGLSVRKEGIPPAKHVYPRWVEKARRLGYSSNFFELLPYALILLVVCFLVLKQPHLSGAILIVAAGAAIFFAAGIKLGWFVVGAGGLAAAVYIVLVVFGYNGSRIQTWLDPWWDPQYKSYQTLQSLYAVSSGGLSGLGFGMSRQKYLYLPEEQNDFIFSIVCEELGLIGASLILILFALLIIRGYWLALHAHDRFGTLVIVGITTLLATQVFLNVAVVTNLTPATGISLPFFSYGGTALAIQLAEMGIVLSISRQITAPAEK